MSVKTSSAYLSSELTECKTIPDINFINHQPQISKFQTTKKSQSQTLTNNNFYKTISDVNLHLN